MIAEKSSSHGIFYETSIAPAIHSFERITIALVIHSFDPTKTCIHGIIAKIKTICYGIVQGKLLSIGRFCDIIY